MPEITKPYMNTDFIKHRFPDRREITLVFSAAVFTVFTWAVRSFIYQVPSFILYFDLWDILGIFALLLTFALLESALVAGLLVLFCALLPAKWLKTGFAYKGFISVVVAASAFIYLKQAMNNQPTIQFLGTIFSVTFLSWLGLILAAHYWDRFQRLILDLADRLSIFLYVYIPLGLLSVIVVIIRLIW
jgi:hypothetical protein